MSEFAPEFVHDPVMRDEIVATFAVVPAGVVLDATLGGGGHSEALLDSRPDLSILGIDRELLNYDFLQIVENGLIW